MALPKLGMKLGSDPVAHGAIMLDKYVVSAPPVVPAALSPLPSYSWGVLGNDSVGDCVPASEYHIDEAADLRRGVRPYPWATHTCISLYSHLTGYVPGNPSTDNGTDPAQAMKYWTTHGLPSHRLLGWGAIPFTSPNVRRAIWEFGAVMFCVALPITAQRMGVNWRYPGNVRGQNAPGSWGGHAVAGTHFDADLLGFISWGEVGDMDNEFAAAYGENVYVPLLHDALNNVDTGPAGFDLKQMYADLQQLT